MGLRNLKITLAYDGTDYSGWQIQKNARSVQGVVEQALERMHQRPIRVKAAGRTDSGVHATGQVISFQTNLDSIQPARFALALNSYLPRDVKAQTSREVPESFHARYDARVRVYRYFVHSSPVPLPHISRYSHRILRMPDVGRLNRLAAPLLGTHDFTSFASAGPAGRSSVRTVHSACFHPFGPYLVFKIAANAYLWKMVRSIVGTLLEVEAGGGQPEYIQDTLEAKDNRRSGTTAPANGLFLEKVVYDGETDTSLY
jgi:tRNA pseudouridine38-40 synthase